MNFTGIITGLATFLIIGVFHPILSTILGVTAFSSFWSIIELKEQRERVRKGWFPVGPGHKRQHSTGDAD